MHIQFLYYEDCPSHDQALERLNRVMDELNVNNEVEVIKVETDQQAQQWAFTGSPTILIDGQDIDPPGSDAFYALTCRAYRKPDGRISPLPPQQLIRDALRKALEHG